MEVIPSSLSHPSTIRFISLCSPIQLHPCTIGTALPILKSPCKFSALHARKKNSPAEPLLKPDIIQQVLYDDDENDPFIDDEFRDDEFMDDADIGDFIEDDYEGESAELFVGDGAGGGGIRLAGTSWDKEVLAIAEDALLSFDGDLQIYAFRTLVNHVVQVRIEKMSNKRVGCGVEMYLVIDAERTKLTRSNNIAFPHLVEEKMMSGSPGMDDIEAFSVAYREKLDEAESAGSIPVDMSLEVSSPGLERVVRIPLDLDRFKERNMYVKYVTLVDQDTTSSPVENDGVFRLVSFDLETKFCTWGIADVKINREKAGKGRPLSKKQKDWRLTTPFDSLRLVRIYADI